MAKTDSLRTLVFIVLILLVVTAGAYLIVLVIENDGFYSIHSSTKLHSSTTSQTDDNKTTQEEIQTNEESEIVSNEEVVDVVKDDTDNTNANKIETTSDISVNNNCLNKYNLTKSTIIFYYQKFYSDAMIPVVQELESSYDFYWTDELWNYKFNSCFGLSGITPTFVCAGTNQKIMGEISKSELENFAKNCS